MPFLWRNCLARVVKVTSYSGSSLGLGMMGITFCVYCGDYCYPTCACAKGLSIWFCPSVSLAVSLSVCQSSEKFWNLNIDRVKTISKTDRSIEIVIDTCVPHREQSSSTLCFSSCFMWLRPSAILMWSIPWIQWIPGIRGLDACLPILWIWWTPGMQTRQVSSLGREAVYVSKAVF